VKKEADNDYGCWVVFHNFRIRYGTDVRYGVSGSVHSLVEAMAGCGWTACVLQVKIQNKLILIFILAILVL
jgi:hypothetical protein